MLTPAQLHDIRFARSDDAKYDASEVDQAMEQIRKDYGEIFTENGDLVRKLSILAAKLDEYRKDEDMLRDVLYNAQKSADAIIAAANVRAGEIVSAAENRVGAIEAEGNGIVEAAEKTPPRSALRQRRSTRISCPPRKRLPKGT